MARLAAITGGTGFLGKHIVEAFAAAGWKLRLLVRRDPRLDIDGPAVELVQGTLADPHALDGLVSKADVVIHVAGAIAAPNREAFMKANAEGTAALASSCRKHAPGTRIVMVSSMAAREPQLSHYAASKAAAEVAIQDAGDNVCILRPSAIYGPGDRETLAAFKAARLPFQPVLNGPEARLCLVDARDVANAILSVAASDGPRGTFEVTDARVSGYDWHDVAEAASRAVGRPSRPLSIPPIALKTFGKLGDLNSAVTGSSKMITSQKVREILHTDWSSSDADHLPDQIWKPSYDLHKGFVETANWYRAVGWLR